jgi:hypothetical protein
LPTVRPLGGEVTLGDAAAHVLDRWKFISKIWLVEAGAWVLMAATFLFYLGNPAVYLGLGGVFLAET